MAISWDRLTTTSDDHPPIFLIYGGEGLGKTTLASEFPNPFYVQTGKNERPPAGVTMHTFGLSETYQDVIDQIDWMLEADHDRLTFALDALDSFEGLVHAEACARHNWADIEEPGYGRGYIAASDVWKEFINKIVDLKHAGFAVVLIAHRKIKSEPGVTSDTYPRYRPNIRRDEDASALTAAADIVGYIHQRVSIAKEDLGFKKTAKRGEGGNEILIAVKEKPGFVAKNRYNLDQPLSFKQGKGYEAISPHIVEPKGRQVGAETS